MFWRKKEHFPPCPLLMGKSLDTTSIRHSEFLLLLQACMSFGSTLLVIETFQNTNLQKSSNKQQFMDMQQHLGPRQNNTRHSNIETQQHLIKNYSYYSFNYSQYLQRKLFIDKTFHRQNYSQTKLFIDKTFHRQKYSQTKLLLEQKIFIEKTIVRQNY